MYLKIHQNPEGRVVAVCDKELIGKILEDDKVHMDLDKYREFYAGEKVGQKEVETALGEFNSANLVGEKAVNIALSVGIVSKEDIMYIKDVPYIQIYKI